jgi:DNA-binding MarR family transcriptional regulator
LKLLLLNGVPHGDEMDNTAFLIVPLLQGFEWFDEGLQASLRTRGWPTLTGTESMVVVHVIINIVRPSDIARSMGLTRQAVHITIGQVVKKGIFELLEDPHDKRGKIVTLTKVGRAMRRDAQLTVKYCAEQLAARIGGENVRNLMAAFAKDWGAPVIRPLLPSERDVVRRRLRRSEDGEIAPPESSAHGIKSRAGRPSKPKRAP